MNLINFKKKDIYSALVCLLIFTITASLIWLQNKTILTIDSFLTNQIQQIFGHPQISYHGNFFNDLMTFFATYGDATPLVLLSFVLSIPLFISGYRFLVFWFLGVVATGGIIGVIMKLFFQRERPLGHLLEDDGGSFPSGHAVGSTLVCLALLVVIIPLLKQPALNFIAKSLVWLSWISILVSRLYFSAHHFSDLIGGVSLAAFWFFSAVVTYSLTADWFKKSLFKKSRI
ncbi:phosphatase PAP2 family protein [Enterococcus pingfangensis]|uniref:phosphatase PAP2 family protein n=1 Tax=Enterococcus pingfangensis TaxID=2559924 RepID=UPI0010F86C49|nr:phosphatase PAP2 family protein [Enterococcus pingfangensis]